MGNRRLIKRVRAGQFHNIRFRDFVRLVEAYGFTLARTQGSHSLYRHPRIADNLNLQPDHGYAKPYQVKQFLALISQHGLEANDV